MKKLAVIFPGMGYTKDKPLLYYAGKILANLDYEILYVEFTNLPKKIQGNLELILKAADMSYEQAMKQLKDVNFSEYEMIVFVGKSIGTIVASRYNAEQGLQAQQIWYTPLQATFEQDNSLDSKKVVAFIGTADPWSAVPEVQRTAENLEIELHVYDDCNHSLECKDVDRNIVIIREVMGITKGFLQQ